MLRGSEAGGGKGSGERENSFDHRNFAFRGQTAQYLVPRSLQNRFPAAPLIQP